MEQKKQCSHRGEGEYFGETYVDRHDCDYVEARNALIPFAEAKANKATGMKAPVGEDARAAYCESWNRAFFGEMDRLWAARCAGVLAMQVAA